MSQSASQAAAFYRDVAKSKEFWTVADKDGIPAPKNPSGQRAMPLWSSKTRVERIIASVPAYAGFEPYSISWQEFTEEWMADLERDGTLVGVNWSGPRAKGYDMTAPELVQNVVAVATGWKPPWRR